LLFAFGFALVTFVSLALAEVFVEGGKQAVALFLLDQVGARRRPVESVVSLVVGLSSVLGSALVASKQLAFFQSLGLCRLDDGARCDDPLANVLGGESTQTPIEAGYEGNMRDCDAKVVELGQTSNILAADGLPGLIHEDLVNFLQVVRRIAGECPDVFLAAARQMLHQTNSAQAYSKSNCMLSSGWLWVSKCISLAFSVLMSSSSIIAV
jgi:hypothetical protein